MVALAFSLALMCFVAVVGTSVQAATGAQYREVIVADAVVESTGQEMLGGLHEGVYDAVAEMTEVQTAVRLKYGHWLDAGRASALSAFDPASIGRVVGIRMADGGLDALTRDGVVIAEGLAEERGLTVGDRLPMTFARTGDQALPIVGVMRDEAAHALQIDVAMSLEGTGEHFTEDMDASVFLVARAGVSAEALTEAVADALISHPTAQVRDQQAVIAGRTQALDEIFGLLSVLLVFATVIAALGVANTLALSVLERTRELGLLRLVGLDRIRAAALVQTEAFALSVLAALLGAALGVGAAIAAVGALSQAAPLDVTAPWPQLLSCTAIVVLAGLLAGVGPAIRAARTPVLAAVHAA
ncbi:ABC transporter permease [Microbacterium sp. GXF7504]